MIGIVGYMSGGKSYTAVELMLKYMRFHHRVLTNIRLNCREVSRYLDVPCVIWKQYYYFLTEEVEPSRYNEVNLSDYSSWPEGSPRGSPDYDANKVYIFLDEVSSIFDSMTSSADGGIQAVATWARHSEKRGQILYLIMQFPNELHKRLRVHITTYIECKNSNNIKIPLIGLGVPFFLRNRIVRTELMPDLSTTIGSSQWAYLDSRIYKCYNTGQIVVGSSAHNFKPVSAVAADSQQIRAEAWTNILFLSCLFWLLFYVSVLLLLRYGSKNV